MNKKQRHDRYVHVYNQMLQLKENGSCEDGWLYPYICDFLEFKCYKESISLFPINNFIEFLLFEPEIHGSGWWELDDFDSRLNALAFCIAMTE